MPSNNTHATAGADLRVRPERSCTSNHGRARRPAPTLQFTTVSCRGGPPCPPVSGHQPAPQARSGLQQVLDNPAIWRARQLAEEQQRHPDKALPTGIAALDAALPDGGWPRGALSELLVPASGIGELSLLLPALRQVCSEARGVALLAPPWLPYARAWEAAGLPLDKLLVLEATSSDLLWSAEQVLRSGECGAVLLWGQAAGRTLDHRALQRLHLAAGKGNALCFLYRSFAAADNPSPAPLRLKLQAQDGGLRIHFVKRRGVFRAQPLPLAPFPAHWRTHTQSTR